MNRSELQKKIDDFCAVLFGVYLAITAILLCGNVAIQFISQEAELNAISSYKPRVQYVEYVNSYNGKNDFARIYFLD